MQRSSLSGLSLLIALAGCGPLEGADGDSGTPDMGMPDLGGPADMGTVGMRPDFPELMGLDTTPDPSCTATWLAAVTGRIVSDTGAPLENARPQLCLTKSDGSFLCTIPPASRADGWYVQVVDPENRCVTNTALRALQPGASSATTYCHVNAVTDGGIYHRPEPVILYDIDAATSLPPEGDPMAPRDVTLADGLVLGEVLPGEFFGAYSRIAGRRITTTPCFAEGMALDGIYALGPEGNPSTTGYTVRIPASGLADGTRVELLVLGGLNTVLVGGEAIAEADLVSFGQGTVMSGVIVGDASARLPELTWLAYRAL